MKLTQPNPQFQNLSVEILRFVDDRFPGWVECAFEDAAGTRHMLIDKAPIFTAAMLDRSSSYPQAGTAPCRVLARWKDGEGCELLRIFTSEAGIEATTGISEFIVMVAQVAR
jgi:hypothetical protein